MDNILIVGHQVSAGIGLQDVEFDEYAPDALHMQPDSINLDDKLDGYGQWVFDPYLQPEEAGPEPFLFSADDQPDHQAPTDLQSSLATTAGGVASRKKSLHPGFGHLRQRPLVSVFDGVGRKSAAVTRTPHKTGGSPAASDGKAGAETMSSPDGKAARFSIQVQQFGSKASEAALGAARPVLPVSRVQRTVVRNQKDLRRRAVGTIQQTNVFMRPEELVHPAAALLSHAR